MHVASKRLSSDVMALPFTRIHPSKSLGVNCTVRVEAGAIFVGGADVGGTVGPGVGEGVGSGVGSGVGVTV